MNIVPKIEKFGSGNQSWLGSAHGTESAQTCTLDISKFTGFKDYIPSGVPLKRADEGGKFEPVTQESDVLAGFLLTDQPMDGDQVAPYVWHGLIRAGNLPEKAFDVTTLTNPNPAFTILEKEV